MKIHVNVVKIHVTEVKIHVTVVLLYLLANCAWNVDSPHRVGGRLGKSIHTHTCNSRDFLREVPGELKMVGADFLKANSFAQSKCSD